MPALAARPPPARQRSLVASATVLLLLRCGSALSYGQVAGGAGGGRAALRRPALSILQDEAANSTLVANATGEALVVGAGQSAGLDGKTPPRCDGAVDLIVLADASGSVGKEGVKHTRAFLKRLIGLLNLGQGAAQQLVGLIRVGASAKIISPLTDNRSQLDGAAASLNSSLWAMDLAQGLALVDTVSLHGRQSASTKVLIIADGPAVRQKIAGEFAGRIAAYAQLVVLLVAEAHDMQAINAAQEWVSAEPPYSQRAHPGMVLRVEDYPALAQCNMVSILAAICPTLVTQFPLGAPRQ